jgi:hypothetical protein
VRRLDGPSAWAVLRLRNEAGLLRERKEQVRDYGYLPHELASLSDAAAAADRMAASIQAGDRRSLAQNRVEFDRFIDYAGSASPYGWKPGTTPVDQIADSWEADEREKEPGDEDRRRDGEAMHRVRAHLEERGTRPVRVRTHLARNPRRRRS